MAEHVSSVASLGLPGICRAQFALTVSEGDLLFCAGTSPISRCIGAVTASPWTHVARIWRPYANAPWLTLEATFARGVHVGLLADYLDHYDGTLVLATRALPESELQVELNAGLLLIDDRYDWQQEVCIASHKLCALFPVFTSPREFYCSGLIQVMSRGTSKPIAADKTPGEMATPEDIYTDPSVMALAVMEAS